jgi:hypothetical protein
MSQERPVVAYDQFYSMLNVAAINAPVIYINEICIGLKRQFLRTLVENLFKNCSNNILFLILL